MTSLPAQPVALADIATALCQLKPGRCLGLIDFNVLPDPVLFRLTHEANLRLRNDISRRLAAALRPQDRLYSLGPWEWLVTLIDVPGGVPMMMAMMRFETLFAEPIPDFDGDLLALRISCGGAMSPDDGEHPHHLVQSARIAALSAARSGEHYAAYEVAMERTDPLQHRLRVELPRALGGEAGLAIHLQPQVDLQSGRCLGAEGLLRWTLPGGDRVDPGQMLAAVERLGLRATFTRWLLQQAMQMQSRLRGEGIDILLSINLTGHDLLDQELPDLIAQTLATWDLPPDCLLLELTETLMIEDTQQVMEGLGRLHKMGFHLSVDDFGTGYASMSYLQRLPVQEVKVDQSFVGAAVSSDKDREIVASMVQLAHRLKLLVVAEGIEDEATEALMRKLGCDRGQGYLYAKALPIDEFIAWWQRREGAPSPVTR